MNDGLGIQTKRISPRNIWLYPGREWTLFCRICAYCGHRQHQSLALLLGFPERHLNKTIRKNGFVQGHPPRLKSGARIFPGWSEQPRMAPAQPPTPAPSAPNGAKAGLWWGGRLKPWPMECDFSWCHWTCWCTTVMYPYLPNKNKKNLGSQEATIRVPGPR